MSYLPVIYPVYLCVGFTERDNISMATVYWVVIFCSKLNKYSDFNGKKKTVLYMVDIKTVYVSDLYSLWKMRADGLTMPGTLNLDRLITEWAEYQLTFNNSPDSLLILASLGLDKKIDRNDIEQCFFSYLYTTEIAEPSVLCYPVVLIKYYMYALTSIKNIKESDLLLSDLFSLDIATDFSVNMFFRNTVGLLRDIYYQHIDVYEYYRSPEIDVLSDEDIISKVIELSVRIYKLLSNEKMISLLSGRVM